MIGVLPRRQLELAAGRWLPCQEVGKCFRRRRASDLVESGLILVLGGNLGKARAENKKPCRPFKGGQGSEKLWINPSDLNLPAGSFVCRLFATVAGERDKSDDGNGLEHAGTRQPRGCGRCIEAVPVGVHNRG